MKYNSLSPIEAIENVKRNLSEGVLVESRKLNEFKKTGMMEQLAELHFQGNNSIESSDLMVTLKGKTNIYTPKLSCST